MLVTYGPALLITRSAVNRELAAWLAAEWLTDPSNQALWVAANHLLPVRQSTLELLSGSMEQNPHYAAALELLPVCPQRASLRLLERDALGAQ